MLLFISRSAAFTDWQGWRELNPLPLGPKPSALSTAPHPDGVMVTTVVATRVVYNTFTENTRLSASAKPRFSKL